MSENAKGKESTVFQKALEEVRHLLDVPCKVSVELGGRPMKIREILQLQANSVVDLPKSAGENVDVYLNGRLLGYGEILALEGTAGVRLTDLAGQA